MKTRNFKIISILIAIILLLSTTLVFADNESDVATISDDPEANTASTNNTSENTTSEENFKKGDVYLTGDNITVDYIIDGNLFICANTVTINSQIDGDAFICANDVTVGEQGYIFSNLFAVSQSVNIKGVVYDVYALSKDVTVTGYIYRDVKVSCQNLNIFGTVGRNAFVNCSNINFVQNAQTNAEGTETTSTAQGMISGDLNYSANKELTFDQGTISGATNYTPISQSNTNNVQHYLLSLGKIIATSVLIWLLCLWIAPKFLKSVSESLKGKKLLTVIGLGILAPIAMSIISIILLILGITANFALILLSLMFIIIAISTSIFIIAINNLVCAKLKIDKTIGIFGMLIATSAVLWLVGLIPYVGSIIGFIAAIVGLGLVVSNIVLTNKKEEQ